MKRVALVVGTRPEIIKCAPVYLALRESGRFAPLLVCTGQHRSMAEQALASFGLTVDHALDLMTPAQTPLGFLSALFEPLRKTLAGISADAVIVQGDTSTAFGAALVAAHEKLPIAHVEAGLRTRDRMHPFPEEMNRVLIGPLAGLHLCPTPRAAMNLAEEGISAGVHVVGNTVVDAIRIISDRIAAGSVRPSEQALRILGTRRPFILVTGHRRENLGEPLAALCGVLRSVLEARPDLSVVYPVHRNPAVRPTVEQVLGNHPRVALTEPLDYPSFIALFREAALVVTDSGGMQEEAPWLGTPVIVTRETSERPEAAECGIAEVVPLREPDRLLRRILHRASAPAMNVENPFGDGHAATRILRIMDAAWG